MFKGTIKLLAGLAFASLAGTANATLIINVDEVGSDVVFSTSGSLDLRGAEFLGGYAYNDGFIPGGDNWYIASGDGSYVDNYAMTSFDGPFGTSTTFFSTPSSVSGDDFYIWGNGGMTQQVGMPVGYLSGSLITSEMIFSNATIASFTMIAGTYNYAIPNDNIILNIGQGGGKVPEPATLALMGLGLLGMGLKQKKKV
jgi:hypothetical protein